MHKCPPAEACRDAFERMSKATVQMALSTTGFGSQVDLTRYFRANAPQPAGGLYSGRSRYSQRQRMKHTMPPPRQTQARQSRPMPRFDMNLEDLFGDDNDNIATGRTNSSTRKPMQTYPGRTGGYSELSSSPTVAPEQESRGRTSPMEYCGNYEGHAFSPSSISNNNNTMAVPTHHSRAYPRAASPLPVLLIHRRFLPLPRVKTSHLG